MDSFLHVTRTVTVGIFQILRRAKRAIPPDVCHKTVSVSKPKTALHIQNREKRFFMRLATLLTNGLEMYDIKPITILPDVCHKTFSKFRSQKRPFEQTLAYNCIHGPRGHICVTRTSSNHGPFPTIKINSTSHKNCTKLSNH